MNKLPMLFCWSFDIQYTDRPEEEYLTQTEFIFQCLEKSATAILSNSSLV